MKNRIYQVIRLSLVLISGLSLAQNNQTITVNNGTFYVLPNTLVSSHSNFENSTSGVVFNDGEFQFYKNYNNDGVYTHTTNQSTGTTTFTGSEPQVIAGSQPSKHYNVTFSNNQTGQVFQLKNDMIIDGTSNFSKGIVAIDSLSGGAMLFTSNATHTNTSDASFAIGTVEKEGNKMFTFPIGQENYYRMLGIGAPKNSSDLFQSKYILANPTVNRPEERRTGILKAIDTNEYWELFTNNQQSHVIITLSWHHSTTPQHMLNDAESMRVVRWDKERELWVDEGGIVDLANKTVTTAVPVEDYGIFTLGLAKTELILPEDIVVYNFVSTNGNGKNDFFLIDNIERYPNNRVEIFNRYGVKVFETSGYGNGNVFRGYSEGRVTIAKDQKLPSGTYYYVLEYDKPDDNGNTQTIKKVGYIHLENE